MLTGVECDSDLRRIQRFIVHCALNLDFVVKMIFLLLPIREGLFFGMNRTNWKSGDFNVNILMFGITYEGLPCR